MRARSIKPGFFKNEYLAECSPAARLLFIGLWLLADREGRLEYRPKRWKGELFPYENVDTVALFEELASDGGLVIKYSGDCSEYVCIPNFLAHQKPHQNESASTIPPHTCDHGAKDLSPRCEAGAAMDESDPAESLFSDSLNPDSLNPSSSSGERTPLPPGPSLPEYSMEFEQLWDLYPRKEAKESAWIAFKGAKAAHQYPGNPIVMPIVAQWLDSPRWQEEGGKFVPMLANWINGRRWEDKFTGPPRELTPEEKAMKDAEEMRRIRAARSLQ